MQAAAVLLLRHRSTGRLLIVANTHITCNFECPDAQLAQALCSGLRGEELGRKRKRFY